MGVQSNKREILPWDLRYLRCNKIMFVDNSYKKEAYVDLYFKLDQLTAKNNELVREIKQLIEQNNALKIIVKDYEKHKMIRPIKRLGLSEYIQTVLELEGIFTIERLYEYSYEDLIAIPGLGYGKINMINKKLGLFLLPPIKKNIKQKKVKKPKKHFSKYLISRFKKMKNYFKDSDILIENLRLEIKQYNVLKRNHVNTLKELVEYEFDDFLFLKNLGVKGREKIILALIEFQKNLEIQN